MFTDIRRYPKCCDNVSFSPVPVQGLSISPAQIVQLTERGFAASSSNIGLSFNEGSINPELTIDNTRGVDASEVWEASQTAKEKLIGTYKKAKKTDNS